MGGKASFDWQIQEESDASLPPVGAPTPPPRGRWVALAVITLGLLALAYWGGQRVVGRAEAQLQEVEQELVVAVQRERVAGRPEPRLAGLPGPRDMDVADLTGTRLQIVELQGDLALVELRLLPDRPWQTKPYRVAKVMREQGGGWTTTAPMRDFWQDPQTLDTDFFRLEFASRNAAVVAEVAPQLDALYLQLHQALGLAAPQPATRLTIRMTVVGGDAFDITDVRYSNRTLIVAPSELLARPEGVSQADALRQAIRYPLAVRLADEVRASLAVPCHWNTLQAGVGLWLRWEGQTLPTEQQWEMEEARRQWLAEEGLPRLDDLVAISQDCLHHPPFLEMEIPVDGRIVPRAALAASLVESIVTHQGRERIPLLLHTLAQSPDWASLSQAGLGMSALELQAQWHSDLVAAGLLLSPDLSPD
jgi:hypothetical protein